MFVEKRQILILESYGLIIKRIILSNLILIFHITNYYLGILINFFLGDSNYRWKDIYIIIQYLQLLIEILKLESLIVGQVGFDDTI